MSQRGRRRPLHLSTRGLARSAPEPRASGRPRRPQAAQAARSGDPARGGRWGPAGRVPAVSSCVRAAPPSALGDSPSPAEKPALPGTAWPGGAQPERPGPGGEAALKRALQVARVPPLGPGATPLPLSKWAVAEGGPGRACAWWGLCHLWRPRPAGLWQEGLSSDLLWGPRPCLPLGLPSLRCPRRTQAVREATESGCQL